MNVQKAGWKAVALRGLVLAVAVWLCVGATARAAGSAPTIKVEVIGKGKVTGTGIACGNGSLSCYTSYGADPTPVTFTEKPSNGWTFSHWDDDGSGCGGSTTCGLGVTGDMTLTAVFTTTGVVQTASFDVALASLGTGTGTVTDNSTQAPIDCPATTCSTTVLRYSTLTVEELPDPGSTFANWGGDCSGRGASCSVYLTTSSEASATFSDTSTNILTVSVSGNGSVTGGGVNCGPGSTCDVAEPANATVALTATPQSGWAFDGWTGDCLGDQPTCNVQMNATRSVSASFVPVVPVLITVNGSGTVSGLGITCGPGPTTCNAGSAPDRTIQLTATPATAGGSVTWGGCSSSAANICSVNLGSSPISISATFNGGSTPPPSSFTLTVSVTGDGAVQSMSPSVPLYCTAAGGPGCSATVQQNSSITLAATPATGAASDFTHWGNDCSSSSALTCTLTFNGSKNVTAAFNGSGTTFLLHGQVEGSGSGTITGAGLRCTGTGTAGCSSPQPTGAKVTLNASPSGDSTFAGWGGACTGMGACTITMSAEKTVTATFTGTSPTESSLALTVVGAGKVKTTGGTCTSTSGKTAACAQQFADGATVTLTATPAAGFAFAGWKGACTGKKTTCTVVLTTDKTVTATFARPALAAAKKPSVKRTAHGTRVTLAYTAGESGTVRLTVTRAGKKVLTRTKKVGAGAAKLAVVVPRHRTYVFTLTLSSKSGKHTLRWTVRA